MLEMSSRKGVVKLSPFSFMIPNPHLGFERKLVWTHVCKVRREGQGLIRNTADLANQNPKTEMSLLNKRNLSTGQKQYKTSRLLQRN